MGLTIPRESGPVPKRKMWSDEDMDGALQEVESGVMTVRKASMTYGIPKSTLHDHVIGKVVAGARPGPTRYLDDEEEHELVRWLEGCSEVGCAKTVREVRAIVGAIVGKKHGVDSITVSHGWWDRFRERHPHLTLRAGESLAYRRAASTSRETIDGYFDHLENVLRENKLSERPSLIFNADESGMPLQHRPGKRIAVKGQKHVHVLASGNKAQITVLACVNATGYSLPPMVVFNRKTLSPELTRGEVPGTIYGLSASGWMDGELFYEWFYKHFLLYAPAARPLLLLLDGHSSHYSPQFIQEASRQGVIVFCLPPNTTHACQPLDVTAFHSLKTFWDQECDLYMSSHPGKIVTIYQFSQIFAAAWANGMQPRTICSGFRATGIYPLNRRAITIPGEHHARSTSTPTAVIARKQGINYLPFYSPISRHRVPLSGPDSSPPIRLRLSPMSSPEVPCSPPLSPTDSVTPTSKSGNLTVVVHEFSTVACDGMHHSLLSPLGGVKHFIVFLCPPLLTSSPISPLVQTCLTIYAQ